MNEQMSVEEKIYSMDQSFRDSVATIDKEGHRKFIFPKQPSGRYYNWRTLTSLVFLLVFFAVPFIKIEGEPFMLFNVLERKFILFGKIFWPQDFFIFAIGLITFIVFIILFTVVFGRLFCGWVCPQTNFMEMVFRKVEYWIDGDATKQMQLKAMPWNGEKIRKRALKMAAFYSIAFVIANFFLAYLIGMDEVLKMVTEGIGNNTGTFFSLIGFTTVFFFVYYWFREQACIVVCPYGRLQGVLLDKNSVVVAYDYVRGEPRGKMKKGEVAEGHGDCIDCFACVRVCPTGIDIRNGTQLECVNCTACMDACDAIMDNIGKPRGLIRYASENNIARKEPTRFTWRMALYSGVLLLLVVVLATLLITRDDVDARILRAQGQTFQNLPDGRVANLFNVKLANKTRKELPLTLKLENVDGEIQLIQEIVVPKESYFQTSFFVKLNRSAITKRKMPLEIGVYQNGKRIQKRTTTFLAPSM
ncbi:MAG TPA: cytochrome c oxidase accessory protein CcoG [Lacibacter sp.]|nr:cytochrome c oxidase accessory protein CcoG [Lacibacter sp.]HMO88287.1 cytochrome c oxidase accessory protein CcoG [Lacibacter sp.]